MHAAENEPVAADPVRALFERAVACHGEVRRELLDRARLEQPAVCDEVEGMLRHFDSDDEILDRNIVDVARMTSGEVDRFAPRSSELEAIDHERTHGSLPIETVIGGFRLVRLIGVGGEATVYEATPMDAGASSGAPVAVKFIRPELVTGEMLARFERERIACELAAATDHPGLVRVHRVAIVEFLAAPRPCLVMELVQGRPLLEYAQSLSLGTRPRLELVAQVCDALHHAHQRGVHHGRLGPRSILVDARARVLDVGLLRLIGTSSVDSLAARATESTGPQVDVLALGGVLYELLIGRRPAAAASSSHADDAVTPTITPPSRFDPSLRGEIDAVTLCALAADPSRRYATMAEMAADIRRILAQPPSTPPAELARLQRRRTIRIAAIAAAATCAGALARYFLSMV